MSQWARQIVRSGHLAVLLVSGASAVLILGPALGSGIVLTYDMAWSPDARWTPFTLGTATPAPRAVPSDAVAVALGKVLGADVAQYLVLFGILLALGLGAASLLRWLEPRAGGLAQCAAVTAALWNPFVSERLVVGQWVVLLGLAVLPWAIRASLAVAKGVVPATAPIFPIAVSALGGVNSLLIVSLSTLVLLVVAAASRQSRCPWWAVAAVLATTLGGAACWALPAIASDPTVAANSTDAFAPTADSPLGVIGSLLGGGGFWNTATHPAPRAFWLNALVSALLCLAAVVAAIRHASGIERRQLMVLVVITTGLTALSALTVAAPVWQWVVTTLPGAGALRDSQKLMGPWIVLTATGLGLLITRVPERLRPTLVGPASALLLLLPLALSPQQAWGIGGRLTAVEVPQSYRTVMTSLSGRPSGDVGLLPWGQYRRYSWNDARVSLSLAPRMVDHVVVYNDELPLRGKTVPGESARAAGISRQVEAGTPPEDALAASGVTYILAELNAGVSVDIDRLRGHGEVIAQKEDVMLIQIAESAPATNRLGALQVGGWVISWVTVFSVTLRFLLSKRRRSYRPV